jgi:hypothetical protein
VKNLTTRRNRVALGIAALPTIDCIVNQCNNAFHLGASNFSSLQIFRSGLLLVLAFTCGTKILAHPDRIRRLPPAAVAGMLLLLIVLSVGLLRDGQLLLVNLSTYGQMLYWLLLWSTAAVSIESHEDAYLVLRGLAIGAVLTAASVFAGLLFGATNFYEGEVGLSSAGWFETAKMISGILVAGGALSLYLGSRKQGWFWPVAALLCFGACVLTYARAGSVALACVLCWLVCWQLMFSVASARRWLRRFFVLAAVAGTFAVLFLPARALFARWDGLRDQGDAAGSGRATFWRIAVDAYETSPASEQLVGRGYHEMSEMLFREYGDDIKHTHDDALDLLLVAGVPGVLWLVLFVGSLALQVHRSGPGREEGATSMAILLTFLCHSVLTGQIWGTDGMTYYTLSLCMLLRMSSRGSVRKKSWLGTWEAFRLVGPQEAS